MEKKISVRISVCERDKSLLVTPQDVGATNEQWERLSEDEKREFIRQYIDDMPDQPFWELDQFREL